MKGNIMEKFILKPIKDEISVEDFAKIDIRVGEIDEVLDIPRSNNLMKLVVNFGDHKRTIIAGIKKERKNQTQNQNQNQNQNQKWSKRTRKKPLKKSN